MDAGRGVLTRPLVALAILAACARGGGDPHAGGERIVSLTPSATEVVAALGATSSLVGVDEYSKFPKEVQALPKVGSFLAPNLEAILRLRPTLVIVDDVHRQTADALHASGIQTVECAMHAMADVRGALRTVGAKLGRTREADRAIAALDDAVTAARAHRRAKRPRVLAVIDREGGGLANLVAAGPGSWLDELLAIAGGDNVLADSRVRYPKIPLEVVVRSQPDIILDLSFAKDGGAAWRELRIPGPPRVNVLDPEQYPYLAGPSPRVAPALEALARALD